MISGKDLKQDAHITWSTDFEGDYNSLYTVVRHRSNLERVGDATGHKAEYCPNGRPFLNSDGVSNKFKSSSTFL